MRSLPERARWKMPLFLLRRVPRSRGKRGKNPFDLAETRVRQVVFFVTFLSLLFFPSSPFPRTPPLGFTRHEIGRPNKANCRTFLVGWRRRRENEGVAAPLRAFACFSAVTLSWQSTGTRCCYRCRCSRASSAPGSSRSSSSSPFISRSSSPSNERYATSNDGYHAAPEMNSDKRCIFEAKLAGLRRRSGRI